jgi:hypothetical protein
MHGKGDGYLHGKSRVRNPVFTSRSDRAGILHPSIPPAEPLPTPDLHFSCFLLLLQPRHSGKPKSQGRPNPYLLTDYQLPGTRESGTAVGDWIASRCGWRWNGRQILWVSTWGIWIVGILGFEIVGCWFAALVFGLFPLASCSPAPGLVVWVR